MSPQSILKQYFGHSTFRPGQYELISALLSQKDVLGIMPTGGGKSICYQIPALMFPGITLVVSPLISLMQDQVHALTENGVKAAYINSALTPGQIRKVMRLLAENTYKIVFVAPERLLTKEFQNALRKLTVSFVAIDEAHCVSQWGKDFRPSYLKIATFIEQLAQRPVVGAFTATATPSVKEDIAKKLNLQSPYVITTGFDRPNLSFNVYEPSSKPQALLSILREHSDKSGIVYCLTRKTVEEVTTLICRNGYNAAPYHAGMREDDRSRNQREFLYDRIQIIVATNAFGMGIDKSNVAYVIHYNMPQNIESYYQEAGRAGRDGSEADCILLYGKSDVRMNRFLIENSTIDGETDYKTRTEIKENDYNALKQMTFYATTNTCLRNFILQYFGEYKKGNCGKCSNCNAETEQKDVTVPAQRIIHAVLQSKQRYGINTLCDILRGSNNQKMKTLDAHHMRSYSILHALSADEIRKTFQKLIDMGVLTVTVGEYPVVKVTSKAENILTEHETVEITVPKTNKRTPREMKQDFQNDTLFLRLKKLRAKFAAKSGLPTFVIFSDTSLIDMCKKHPTTTEEFLDVNGVGEIKCAKYANAFIEEIIAYDKEQTS